MTPPPSSPPSSPPAPELVELFGARAAVVVPAAIDDARAAAVRARLAATGWQRYDLVDRGRYAWTDAVDEPALVDAVAAIAADVTGAALAVQSVRALHLVAGDYLLAHHDRLHADRKVELVLDLSAAPTAGAEVHYRRHGRLFHRVPSRPGALSLVERDAAVTCHHTYVSKRHTTAGVTRLVVRFAMRDQ